MASRKSRTFQKVVKNFYHQIIVVIASSSTHYHYHQQQDGDDDEKKKKKNFLGKIVIFDRSIGETRALISVSDKTNLDKLASGLVALGFEVISTGGSAKFIQDKNSGDFGGLGDFVSGDVGRKSENVTPGDSRRNFSEKRERNAHETNFRTQHRFNRRRRCELVPISRLF